MVALAQTQEMKMMAKTPDTGDLVVNEVLRLVPELGRTLSSSIPSKVMHQGVSTAQVRALVHLAEHGPLKMGDLARGLRITTPSTTGLINPLARMGLVERDRDDDDRRVVRVKLTGKAKTMAGQVVAQRRAEVQQALEGMDGSAQEDLLQGLRRLAAAYDLDSEEE